MKSLNITLSLIFYFLLTSGQASDFIWRITKKGSPLQVFFVGTAHVPTSPSNHPDIMAVINYYKPKYVLGEISIPQGMKYDSTPFKLRSLAMTYNEGFLKCHGIDQNDEINYKNFVPTQDKFFCPYDDQYKLRSKTNKVYFHIFRELLWHKYGRPDNLRKIENIANAYTVVAANDIMHGLATYIAKKNRTTDKIEKEKPLYRSLDRLIEGEAVKAREGNWDPRKKAKILLGFDKDIKLSQHREILNELSKSSLEFAQSLHKYNYKDNPLDEAPLKESFDFSSNQNFTKLTSRYISDIISKVENGTIEHGPFGRTSDYLNGSHLYYSNVAQFIIEKELTCSTGYLESIFKRNNQWAKRIQSFFTDEKYNQDISIMATGGLGHIVGSYGLFYRLLEEYKGYKIERVYLDGRNNNPPNFILQPQTSEDFANFCE